MAGHALDSWTPPPPSRAFSIKPGLVTKSTKYRLVPSQVDPELCPRHESQGRLVCMMSKKVDALKTAGGPQVVQQMLAELQRAFGEWRTIKFGITSCRVRRIQDPETHNITWGRTEFEGTLWRRLHACS